MNYFLNMSTIGLSMMIGWMSIVTLVTAYLFYRVLTTKKKNEPDSYSEND